jgi:apolipoprotein N-acyltransferase
VPRLRLSHPDRRAAEPGSVRPGLRDGRLDGLLDRRPIGLAAAVVTGLALVLAFPAADLGALAFVALVPLLLAAERRRPTAAGVLGVLAGLVFFALHVTWIAQIGSDRAAGILALAALTVVQALFLGAFFALVPASARLGWARLPLLAATWAAIELVRAQVPLGGFAWGLLGLSQHDGGPLLPLARVVGVYGLSAVIAAVNLVLAGAVLAAQARRARPALALAGLAVLLPLTGLAAPAPPPVDGPSQRLAVVQGSVPFDRSNRGQTNQAVFQRHVAMTEALAGAPTPPDLVVWGEGAADDDPTTTPSRAEGVAAAAAAARAPLLLGSTTVQGGVAGKRRYATEGLLFTAEGRLADRYVKRRLVPFGEYIPAARLLRRLVPATNQLPYDKVPGTELRPMLLDGTRFGVLICYETAYPQDTRSLARDGAQFVVVLANNASFGRSPLARQHLATSQLRAVEEGRTVVHAALSGISGVVGPDGRVTGATGLYQSTILLAEVQPRGGLTPYARIGRLVEAVLVGLAVALLAAVAADRLRRRSGETVATSGTNEPAASAVAATGSGLTPGAADPASSASAPDRPAPGPAPT